MRAATVSELLKCSFFFQAEDGIRDSSVTGVQTCALPISVRHGLARRVELGAQLQLLQCLLPFAQHAQQLEVVDAQWHRGRGLADLVLQGRSEERRVGKECRSRRWPYH